MKYINYKTNDSHVGVLEDDIIYRLDYPCIIDAIRDKLDVLESYKNNPTDNHSDVKVLAPVSPSKVVCVGLNYTDHAQELSMELPTEPLLFMKPSTSIIAHNNAIIYPDSTNKLDYEGELGIVIIDEINRNTPIDDFNIAYTIVNDVTSRDLQEKDGQWTRAKSFDTFCPIGPVVTTDINPLDQVITTSVNGEVRQDSNTSKMIFTPKKLVRYISNIMKLNPGDVIATGTPPGVGQLEKGDVVEISIEDIGVLRNIVK